MKLVHTRQHGFTRWDDPNTGERINIECTSQGFCNFPDEHYMHWPFEVDPAIAQRARWLQSNSPTEEFTSFLHQRAHCLLESGRFGPALQAFALALSVLPVSLLCRDMVAGALNHWGDKISAAAPPNAPALRFDHKKRMYPKIPAEFDQAIIQNEVMEALLQTSREPHRTWWESLRKSPHRRPANVPTTICIDEPDSCIAYHRGLKTCYQVNQEVDSFVGTVSW